MLEKVRHRATGMVPGLAKQRYEDRLKLTNLPSLAYRRLYVEKYNRSLQIYAWNILCRLHSDPASPQSGGTSYSRTQYETGKKTDGKRDA
jgi:hypothetical protein